MWSLLPLPYLPFRPLHRVVWSEASKECTVNVCELNRTHRKKNYPTVPYHQNSMAGPVGSPMLRRWALMLGGPNDDYYNDDDKSDSFMGEKAMSATLAVTVLLWVKVLVSRMVGV